MYERPSSNRMTGNPARALPGALISNEVTGDLARALRVCTCRAMDSSGAARAGLGM